ncbi:hypothetical protein ACTXGK_05005 [Psychrobacter sp. T6-5]
MPLHTIQTNDNKQITVKDVFIQQKTPRMRLFLCLSDDLYGQNTA